MMRIYFCPSCKCWRIVSNRLEAECLDCGSKLLLSDIPFEKWVELDYDNRDRIAQVYLGNPAMTASSVRQSTLADVRARMAMEGILGESVPSNQPERVDTGYDY